jgi:hypothetical protein
METLYLWKTCVIRIATIYSFLLIFFCQQPVPVFLFDLKTDSSDYYIEIFEFKAPRIILPNSRSVYLPGSRQTGIQTVSPESRQAVKQREKRKRGKSVRRHSCCTTVCMKLYLVEGFLLGLEGISFRRRCLPLFFIRLLFLWRKSINFLLLTHFRISLFLVVEVGFFERVSWNRNS